jgi:hypothetical protein
VMGTKWAFAYLCVAVLDAPACLLGCSSNSGEPAGASGSNGTSSSSGGSGSSGAAGVASSSSGGGTGSSGAGNSSSSSGAGTGSSGGAGSSSGAGGSSSSSSGGGTGSSSGGVSSSGAGESSSGGNSGGGGSDSGAPSRPDASSGDASRAVDSAAGSGVPGCTLPATVSFQKNVLPFLTTSCSGSGCHVIDNESTVSAGGFDHGYDWITAGAHASSCPETPTPLRFQVVIAVIDEVDPPTCSKAGQMPPATSGKTPLTPCQVATLQAWLDEPLVTQLHRPDDSSPTTPYPMPPFN